MRRLVTLLPVALWLGCLEAPPYRCERDTQCFLQGYPGTCDRPSSTCVYPSVDCRGILSEEGYVNGQGNCVPPPNSAIGPGTSSTGDAESSTSASSPQTWDGASAESSGEGPEESSTTRGMGESSSSGSEASTGASGCDQPTQDITNYGTVSASSELNGYPATSASDGDNTTSWFTDSKDTAQYTWASESDRCIDRIEIDDNSLHTNAKLRVNFGFQQSVVRVLQAEVVVFEETIQLPGTPDGNYAVETGGVVGSEVALELGPNDGGFFGGFSELRVYGDP